MAFEELALQYAKQIISSSDKEYIISKIEREIDRLTFQTGVRLSNNDKINLWMAIRENLYKKGTVLLKEASSDQYIQLVNHVIAILQQASGSGK